MLGKKRDILARFVSRLVHFKFFFRNGRKIGRNKTRTDWWVVQYFQGFWAVCIFYLAMYIAMSHTSAKSLPQSFLDVWQITWIINELDINKFSFRCQWIKIFSLHKKIAIGMADRYHFNSYILSCGIMGWFCWHYVSKWYFAGKVTFCIKSDTLRDIMCRNNAYIR